MSMRRIATALVLLSLEVPGWIAAQGLGDAAARERARRAKEGQAKEQGPAKTFTNEDLAQGQPAAKRSQGEEGSSTAPSPPPMDAATRSEEPSERSEEQSQEQDRRDAEQPLLEAVNAAQSRLSEVEQRIQELQSKLNPMSGSFIYGATGSNSTAEEAEVRAELSRAEGELTAARQNVATAVQAVEDFRQGRITTPPAPR